MTHKTRLQTYRNVTQLTHSIREFLGIELNDISWAFEVEVHLDSPWANSNTRNVRTHVKYHQPRYSLRP